jgi:mannose-6-phosphate isomerase-like protein (cupin superfamily)
MRTPTLFFFAMAMMLVASTAAAAPQASPANRSTTTPTYQLQPAQVQEVTGVYRLDSGGVIKVTNQRRKLFVELGQHGPVEMVPVAENHFVSLEGRMTMEFRPIAFGDEIVLTYPSDFNVADAKPVTVRLAAD